MLYTITTSFKTDRLYTRTDRIDSDTPKEAKMLALTKLMEEHPDAVEIRQRAQKSHNV